MINQRKVTVYINDILVHAQTKEALHETTIQVLDKLRENKLFLKLEKCEFEKTEIEFLGMVISHGHVSMDPVKVNGVRDWPTPKNKKDIQSFLGFANFYRRFIKDYGRIAKPLTRLTGKETWQWEPEQQEAFEALKVAMTTAPALVIPNNQDPFRLECDASDYALGGVLSQHRDSKWHPVAFLSKAMTEAQRNYEIYDKELLSVMMALDEWRHLLIGTKEPFEIWNDHKNLEYFRKPQKLNRRQARWVMELADYNYTLHHKPGTMMQKPDTLSRHPDHNLGKEDNQDKLILTLQHFRLLATHIQSIDAEILDQIKLKYKDQDLDVTRTLAKKEKGWTDNSQLITWEH